jgi:hypothetical protein
MLFDLKWLLQRRDQPFGQTSCAAGLRLKTLNDAKLITANSRYECGLFYNCFYSSRDLYQQSITNRVPKKVVLSRFSSGLFRAMFAMKERTNGKEIHR